MVLAYGNLFFAINEVKAFTQPNCLFSSLIKDINGKMKVDILNTKWDKDDDSDFYNYLTSYLAGLIEGDGHFNVGTPLPYGGKINPKSLKGKSVSGLCPRWLDNKPAVCTLQSRVTSLYPLPVCPDGFGRPNTRPKGPGGGIEVVFALKDRPLAEFLKTKFGGNLYVTPNRKMVRWMVKDIKSVSNIMNAINGKLRTPKINSFYNLIDFVKLKGVIIEKLPLDTSPLSSNAWLAGFIDADGCFAIKGFTESPGSHIGIQFYLSQRRTDKSGESLEKVMLQIAEFLSTKLSQRVITNKYHQFVINTSGATSNNILIEYLNNFPNLSSKYLDYKDWETASNIYVKKLHKDPAEYQKIRTLKLNMNSNRTYFDWSHLHFGWTK